MTSFALEKVEVAQTPPQRFEEFLQSRGKRITQPRRLIIEQVFSHHEHFDADELLAQLRASGEGRKVGRATVYRTLQELVDSGLLRTMTLGGRAVYEHDYGYPQHDHFHCTECNRLFEFENEKLQQLRDELGREHHFRVTGHRLIISGVCEECTRAKRRARHKMNMI